MENTEKKEVVIYAYGYCNNAGAGSWISYLEYNGFRKKIEGQVVNTDKNRMELTSMVEALKSLKEPCIVTLYSNSQYCVNAISKGWAKKWAFNNWMRTKTERTLNPDLWEQVLTFCTTHEIMPVWIRPNRKAV